MSTSCRKLSLRIAVERESLEKSSLEEKSLESLIVLPISMKEKHFGAILGPI